MSIIIKCITVYLIGVLELWGAVPAGFAFKLNPIYIAVFSAAGAATGAYIVLLLGEPLRKWLMSLRKTDMEKPDGRFNRIWKNYGIPGLCLLAPFLIGAPVGTAIALAFGGKRSTIALWMTISCIIWAVLFTVLGVMGISFFQK